MRTGTNFLGPHSPCRAATRRSKRRLSRIAKGLRTRCSKQAYARIAKGGGLYRPLRFACTVHYVGRSENCSHPPSADKCRRLKAGRSPDKTALARGGPVGFPGQHSRSNDREQDAGKPTATARLLGNTSAASSRHRGSLPLGSRFIGPQKPRCCSAADALSFPERNSASRIVATTAFSGDLP